MIPKKAGASARVALLGICYDGSSSYLAGAALAPPIIRKALWSEAGNPWSETGLDLSTAALDDEGTLSPGRARPADAPSRPRSNGSRTRAAGR